MNYILFVKCLFDEKATLKRQSIRKEHKVSYATKLLSNYFYLNEVELEAKTTSKFNKHLGIYDQYIMQIITSGNCITLLSNSTAPLDDVSFWNPNYFEDLAKYVFWTFNRSFLIKITETLHHTKPSYLKRCIELLKQNRAPYNELLDDCQDEEVIWCHVKNEKLKADPRFSIMYVLDKQNRTAILLALKNSSEMVP